LRALDLPAQDANLVSEREELDHPRSVSTHGAEYQVEELVQGCIDECEARLLLAPRGA